MSKVKKLSKEMGDGPSQTLAKGLKILDLLAASDAGMRATQVARAFDLNLNTAGRLLATLEASGFATRDSKGFYSIGARLIGAAIKRFDIANLTNLAHPFLLALRDETGETSFIVARVGMSLVVLDLVEGKHALRVVIPAGSVTPLFPATTAFTTTLDLSPEEVVQLSQKSGHPSRTVNETEVLRARAELTKQGYLVRHAALHSEGTCTAAAPIKHKGATIASIGIAGPSSRWNEDKIKQHAKLIRQTAHDLSAQVGSGTF